MIMILSVGLILNPILLNVATAVHETQVKLMNKASTIADEVVYALESIAATSMSNLLRTDIFTADTQARNRNKTQHGTDQAKNAENSSILRIRIQVNYTRYDQTQSYYNKSISLELQFVSYERKMDP